MKKAITENKAETLAALLGEKPSESELREAWWESVKLKNVACMQVLLEMGTPVESRDPQSWTAMHHTANDGSVDMLNMLLTYGADLTARSVNDRTPLHIAVRSKNEACVRALLDEGAEMWSEDCNQSTAIVYATQHVAIMKMLLEHMQHDNDDAVEYQRHRQLNKSIMNATLLENTETLQLLIDHGGDANAYDGRPLNTALMRGNACVVKTLLEGGARPAMCKMTVLRPLFVAVFKGHVDCVKLLLQYGVDVNERHVNGDTPLLVAASEGQNAMVRYLVEHGAQVNHQGARGETALFTAVYNGYDSMTKILLESGASTNIGVVKASHSLGMVGTTLPIHNLLSRTDPLKPEHLQCFKYLLQYESDVDSVCYDPRYPDIALTPVVFAWWNQHLHLFHVLQAIGCTIPRKDISHLTTRRQVLHPEKNVPSETIRKQLEQMQDVPGLQALCRRAIRKVFIGRIGDLYQLDLPLLIKEYLDYSDLDFV